MATTQPAKASKRNFTFLWVFALLTAAGIGAAIWIFLTFKAYTIPQNGMYPTYGSGTMVIGRKSPYNSVKDVHRGDVVVFSTEKDGKKYDIIWRVIGLPGETISIAKDYVFINKKRLDRNRLRAENAPDPVGIYDESGDGHKWLIALPEPAPDEKKANMPERKLGDDEVFVMGDNRDAAYDSRETGPVKFSQIQARVVFPRN